MERMVGIEKEKRAVGREGGWWVSDGDEKGEVIVIHCKETDDRWEFF